jgi:hypothetical protein
MARSAPASVTITLARDGERRPADLALVDLLLRLRLETKRQGWALRVEGAGDDVRELFAFLGLGELLAYGSGLELRGESERGEQ